MDGESGRVEKWKGGKGWDSGRGKNSLGPCLRRDDSQDKKGTLASAGRTTVFKRFLKPDKSGGPAE